MTIRILTSCTGDKKHAPPDALKQDDFRCLNAAAFAAAEAGLEPYRTPAEGMYTGLQHVRLMDGVRAARAAGLDVDLSILSAGYGLIASDRPIVPYECTFQGMKKTELRDWSRHLGIPDAARRWLAEPADLALVLLGDAYLEALQLAPDVPLGAPTIFLTAKNALRHIAAAGAYATVPLSGAEATRFHCALVGLKGELAKRLLTVLVERGPEGIARVLAPDADLLTMLDGDAGHTRKPRPSAAIPNPRVDVVISIPQSWWDKPHRQKLRYFIPEWDDLVDPDYDFETDTHSGGRGDWSNEVYAHQLYPEPNYDGILVSKVIAEASAKKKQRINAMGVHRYLRVPREFPIMGDCGAFGYIMDDVPPYSTAEILDYYTRLGFDYGVSVDHLIVKATEEQKQFRYDLTIHNAEEFLREHRAAGLAWEPVGAVQGWDPKSYAEAARQYVAMGYRYIGLGGLVRTNTAGILSVLAAVHAVVPPSVSIHVFGVSRLAAMQRFADQGVRSVDSASHLRRAWMGSGGQNYLTSEAYYTAIRIPEVGKSFRAKRMVSEGRVDGARIDALARRCFQGLLDYDTGRAGIEHTLDVLEEYDRQITPNRVQHRQRLQRTLESMPWKQCACDICRHDGVQVIIFRGNNRNRRRGFHNTYVFYRLMQQALEGQVPVWLRQDGVGQQKQLPLFDDTAEDD